MSSKSIRLNTEQEYLKRLAEQDECGPTSVAPSNIPDPIEEAARRCAEELKRYTSDISEGTIRHVLQKHIAPYLRQQYEAGERAGRNEIARLERENATLRKQATEIVEIAMQMPIFGSGGIAAGPDTCGVLHITPDLVSATDAVAAAALRGEIKSTVTSAAAIAEGKP